MSLEFIYSPKRRKNIEDILYSFHPNHQQRCFIVGFLNKCCNMSAKDIFTLIKNESNWGDLNLEICSKQISSLCSEPTGFDSEDLSFNRLPAKTNVKKDNACYDNSIFSKLNKAFFDGALLTAYEYSLNNFNLYGKLQWNVLKYPIYRSIEGRNNKMLYVDLDCKDLKYGWEIAKEIYYIDKWDFFKYSGSRGFHLCKFIKNVSKDEMYNMLDDIYQSVKSNLVSFEYENKNSNTKIVNIDPSSVNRNRLIRAYCLNMKSNQFSIPLDIYQNIDEMLSISSDIDKIKSYINSNYK